MWIIYGVLSSVYTQEGTGTREHGNVQACLYLSIQCNLQVALIWIKMLVLSLPNLRGGVEGRLITADMPTMLRAVTTVFILRVHWCQASRGCSLHLGIMEVRFSGCQKTCV